MPHYKLMYFNSRGRAEATRMIFALAGQDYEDYRFKEGEWPGKLKEDTSLFPLGQAPVLLIDGKPMPHAQAINQHLGREFGFYGANNAEAAKIDVIGETINDIVMKMLPLYFMKDEEKRATSLAEYRDNEAKPFMTYLNNAVKEAGGRFFIGNSETLADIAVYVLMDYAHNAFGKDFFSENYPALAKFYQGITENSKLSAYIKSRPEYPLF